MSPDSKCVEDSYVEYRWGVKGCMRSGQPSLSGFLASAVLEYLCHGRRQEGKEKKGKGREKPNKMQVRFYHNPEYARKNAYLNLLLLMSLIIFLNEMKIKKSFQLSMQDYLLDYQLENYDVY